MATPDGARSKAARHDLDAAAAQFVVMRTRTNVPPRAQLAMPVLPLAPLPPTTPLLEYTLVPLALLVYS
jgi:hypothetical protein